MTDESGALDGPSSNAQVPDFDQMYAALTAIAAFESSREEMDLVWSRDDDEAELPLFSRES